MQHKQYFAALVCGVLCLTGCLKNEESDSVTQVRNAKTNEINSVAALNNAKAEAETTLANAEAAVMASEAKVNEAQAKLILANAALVEAQTKLEELNLQLVQLQIELQSIQNEEERVRLEQMKVQLQIDISNYERIVAQNQALIAAANTTIADEARKLENVARQIEIDAVNMAQQLLAAELALFNQENANANAEITYYGTILAAYNAALNRINTLNGLIIAATNNNIALEAGLQNYVDTFNGVLEAQNKIIADNEALIAAIEKYADMTKEELDEAKRKLLPTVIKAVNDYQTLLKEYSDLVDAREGSATVNGIKTRINNETAYKADLTAFIPAFQTWAVSNGAKVDAKKHNQIYWTNPETKANEELFTPEYTENETIYLPSEEEYKALEEAGYIAIGTYEPGYSTTVFQKIVPATFNTENIAAFCAKVEKDAETVKNAAIKTAADNRDKAIKAANDAIDALKAADEAKTKYVNSVKEEMDAAYEAQEKAKAAAKTAQDTYDAALAAATTEMAGDHSIELATKAYNDAKAAAAAAATAVADANTLVITTFPVIATKLADGTSYVYDPAVTGHEYKTPEWNFDRADFRYKSTLVTAESNAELYEDAVAEFNKAKGTFKTNEKALADALADFEAAKIDLVKLRDAYEEATLEWIKAGSPASGKAYTAYTKAQSAYNAKYAEIYTDPGNIQSVYDAADAVMNNYDPGAIDVLGDGTVIIPAGQKGWNGAKKWLDTKKTAVDKILTDGTTGYDKWVAAAKQAIKDYNDAVADVPVKEAAKKAADEAEAAALKNVTDVIAEKDPANQQAVKDAAKALTEAKKAVTAANATVTDKEATYTNYATYYADIYPTEKAVKADWDGGAPYTLTVNKIKAENANIEAANNAYSNKNGTGAADVAAANFKKVQDTIGDDKKAIDAMVGEMGAYTALVTKYNDALAEVADAWIAKEKAKAVKDAYQNEYNALVAPTYYDVNGVAQDVNKDIETAKKAIETAKKAIETASNTMVTSTNKDKDAIAANEALIAQYKDELAYQQTLVDYYGAILAEFVKEDEVPAE